MLNCLHICCSKCLCRVVPGSIRGFNLIAAIVILQSLWVLHQPSSLELVLNPVHLTAFHLSRRQCSQCFFLNSLKEMTFDLYVTVYSVWDWPKREATTSVWVTFCNVNLIKQGPCIPLLSLTLKTSTQWEEMFMSYSIRSFYSLLLRPTPVSTCSVLGVLYKADGTVVKTSPLELLLVFPSLKHIH